MSIYTYVVNHEKDSPAVGASTTINGGRLQAVMFDDALIKLEAAEELLWEVMNCRGEIGAELLGKISDYLNNT